MGYKNFDEVEVHQKAIRHYYDFIEYIKYSRNKEYWENMSDPVVEGLRNAIGHYFQSVNTGEITFNHFAACLSSDYAGGVLMEARKQKQLPDYNRRMAKKYKIAAGYSCMGNAVHEGTDFPTIPDCLTEIKHSEFLAIQGE
ncbi:hypothetical protein FHQ26_01430 [Testudinibacter sp. TR-2022]|uniref:DUF5420 family protein n=1 Tax=Testudinibacter sp. TR-2022 TaxID=2585029 RepID=UPI00111B9279|nr:DUF5420 family protein [Testudinibacter sp. TR-2022]TNH04492.1 hypothetical protein FHQ22_04445 [Pasteurellaceae bacterium Phil31]TNH11986.1 hypothetical protein FHQ25_01490 [Testudinibacter sp. TR-2022]TNH12709.1 hypothetical protein FHQ26_01430 [Testudinibacter sp. TR-2022]TNH13698.1 hypothetical protein FIA56_06615 [Testudinibacter sp. TR-2022]TNH17220.1 hypothetical protein FHQ23_07195 [Testudinibacter sp. TR-2022]